MKRLKVLTPSYYPIFLHDYSYSSKIYYNKLSENELDLKHCNVKAAVYSYMIDNEHIDAELYFKYQQDKNQGKDKSFIIVDDIIKAYEFAQKSALTGANILKAHKICAKNVLTAKEKGKLRKHEIVLKRENAENLFTPASINGVEGLFDWLDSDIILLQKRDLRLNIAFYYASYLHIALLHISPFAALNEVMARLVEKWFLSEKLDSRAWLIPSEEFYYYNRTVYFDNIQKMGKDFFFRNYESARDFVLMLPAALEASQNKEID